MLSPIIFDSIKKVLITVKLRIFDGFNSVIFIDLFKDWWCAAMYWKW